MQTIFFFKWQKQNSLIKNVSFLQTALVKDKNKVYLENQS